MIRNSNKRKLFLFMGILVMLLFILAACGQDSSGEIEEADNQDNGSETEEAALPYERIVVDSPSVAHYMSIYDVPLVGVPTTSKPLPEEYEDLTEIGVAVDPNIERIVSLDPEIFIGDEVLAQFSKERVESRGIETFYIDNSSYDAVFDSIMEIGELMGQEDVGEAFIAEQKEQEAEILDDASDLEGKKVALLMGTAESYQLGTEHSYLGSILEKIGMENIANEEETDQGLITFNKESLVASNPDYIIAHAHGGEPEQVEETFKEEFSHTMWDDTTAKQQDQIFYIDSYQFPVTGSIDNVDVLKQLVALLEGQEDAGAE